MSVLLACACGRLGFESSQLQPTDAGPDVPQIDAALMEVLIEGENLIADSSIVSSETGRNCGTCNRINGGAGEAGLLRVDVSGLPQTPVRSARLELYLRVVFTPGGMTDAFVVTEEWDAGEENAADGVANWIERLPGVPWSSVGVGPDSRETEPFATFVPLSLEEPVVIEIPTTLVTQWRDSPDTNFGIVFIGRDYPGPGGDHPHFHSTESSIEPERRPRVFITVEE